MRSALAAACIATSLAAAVDAAPRRQQATTPSTTPSTTPPPTVSPSFSATAYCAGRIQFNQYGVGAAGTVSGSTGDGAAYTPTAQGFADDGATNCTGTPYAPGPAHYVRLDFGAAVPLGSGGLVWIDTCGTAEASALYTGPGCPVDGRVFSCLAFSADDATGWCGLSAAGGDAVLAVPVEGRYLYVIVADGSGASLPINYTLSWQYVGTPTPSASASPVGTPVRTGTSSGTHTRGASPSGSLTATANATASRSLTPSSSRSPSAPPSPRATRTTTATQTQTASPSRAAYCGAAVALGASINGSAGAVTLNSAAAYWAGADAALAGMACNECDPGGGEPYYCIDDINVVPPGNKVVVLLDLGAAVVLGGALTLDTCAGPFFDTVIFVGLGCPDSPADFVCATSNDDGCGRQSVAVLLPVLQRIVYVVVAGVGGAAAPFTLSWAYMPPPGTPSGTGTPTITRTSSPTAVLSLGASPSRTPAVSPTPTQSATRSGTPSGSATPGATPAGTPSHSPTAGACAATLGGALAAALSGMNGSFSSTTAGAPALFPYGNCAAQGAGGAVPPAAPPLLNIVEDSPQALISIDIGFSPSPALAAALQFTVDACAGTNFNSALFVGASCPAPPLFSSMGCVLSNDDALCDGVNVAPASRVVLPALVAGVSVYYVLIAGTYGAYGEWTVAWSVAPPASATASPSSTGSASPSIGTTPQHTPSQSSTPMRTRTAVPTHARNAFSAEGASLLVWRSGNGGSAEADGTALPLFVDEVSINGGGVATLQTITLPAAAVGGAAPCTLGAGSTLAWPYDAEGVPASSPDGALAAIACYSTPAGAAMSTTDDKVVALLRPDGTVDTNTRVAPAFAGAPSGFFTAPPPTQALRAVAVAAGGATFYVIGSSGSAGSGAGGVWCVPYGAAASPVLLSGAAAGDVGFSDVRAVAIANGTLFVASSDADTPGPTVDTAGVFALPGPGVPASYGPANASMALRGAGGAAVFPATTVPSALIFEPSGASLWLADAATSTVLNARKSGASATWALVPAAAVAFDAVHAVRSLAGRIENSAFALYAATGFSVYRYNTVTRAAPTQLLYRAPAGALIRGVTLPPLDRGAIAATATRSGSPTPSPGVPPTAPPSPTRAASTINAFSSASVLVLRLGDGVTYYQPGKFAPLFWDERSTAPGAPSPPLSSVALPHGTARPAGGGFRCVLAVGSAFAAEGVPALSGDGTVVTAPCYDAPAASFYNPSAGKTVALLRSDASLDTGTRTVDAYSDVAAPGAINAFVSAVAASSASGFWLSGSSAYGDVDAGVRFLALGGGPSHSIAGTAGQIDARALSLYGGRLYASLGASEPGIGPGIAVVSGGDPAALASNATGQTFAPLLGVADALVALGGPAIAAFAFETPTRLWAALAPNASGALPFQLGLWTTAVGGNWTLTGSFMLDASGTAVAGLAVRLGDAGSRGAAIYAATPATLVRVNASTGATRVIAIAAPNTFFRGVVLPPLSAGGGTPAGSVSASPTPTGTCSSAAASSATALGTSRASGTTTPTGSGSGTNGATAAASASGAASATPASRSGSASGTPAPSSSGTPQSAPSLSASPTISGSSLSSWSSSGTAAPSPSSSLAGGASSSPSPTATRSGAVATPSASPTATASPQSTPTTSSSSTVMPSSSSTSSPAASTAGPTTSRTASATPLATGSATRAAATATATSSVSVFATASSTGSPTGAATPSDTQTASGTVSGTAAMSATPTAASTSSGSVSASPSQTAASSVSGTVTGTALPTPSSSSASTASASLSASPSATGTASAVSSPSGTGTRTATRTPSGSRTPSATRTRQPTPSGTAARTPTASRSGSHTHSGSRTSTTTRTSSHTATRTPTHSSTHSRGASASRTETKIPSKTPTASRSSTHTPSTTRTATGSRSATRTATASREQSRTRSATRKPK